MSLDRVSVVTPTAPVAITDYQAIIAQLEARLDAFTGREIVDGSTIREGTIIVVGGVAYKATTDTSITGSASNYVKITPAGATASAAFVANLTGVSWSNAYGGYYDVGGNLHIFDEARAKNEGVISSVYTLPGKIAYISGALDINGALTGATTISASGAISGASLSVTGQVSSSVATGTAPLSVASTTKVANLNSDLFDDLSSLSFLRSDTPTTSGGVKTADFTLPSLQLGELYVFSNNANGGNDPITLTMPTSGTHFITEFENRQGIRPANQTFNVSAGASVTVWRIK